MIPWRAPLNQTRDCPHPTRAHRSVLSPLSVSRSALDPPALRLANVQTLPTLIDLLVGFGLMMHHEAPCQFLTDQAA